MQLHFYRTFVVVSSLLLVGNTQAFSLGSQQGISNYNINTPIQHLGTAQFRTNSPIQLNANEEKLAKTFGGYTVKQRLREEVESPFRKVRFALFGVSTGSASLALYFSATNVLKAYMGGFSDAIPMEEALSSCGINLTAVLVCGYLTYTDYKKGEANLARIKRGGALAKLQLKLPDANLAQALGLKTLSDFRRGYRVMICAGGKERIEDVCRSLCADQLKDENTLADKIQEVDTLVVPVLLIKDPSGSGKTIVGDTRSCWMGTNALEGDQNFDPERADAALGFPQGNVQWEEYLSGDVETASGQGFDVLNKGITLIVKKNGKILRRVTGMPKWSELIGTMDVMDGSKFGMPGDSEKYGGP